MPRSLYLINPKAKLPSYTGGEAYAHFGVPPATLIAELALPTVVGSVQTSRGCPFECEFCDVIVYLGRKQRHKPIANVLTELDECYRHGYRRILLSDDNLTVYRRRAKELLAALSDWNERQQHGQVEFNTQLSIDTSRDEELLEMCSAAGLTTAFIGIETPNRESLVESKKPQNLVDLVREVHRFVEHGIAVLGGIIVGFDHDGPDIFERQFEFLQALPLPHITFGALVAPEGTALERRIRAAGRIDSQGDEVIAMPWNSNIVPARMSSEEFRIGSREARMFATVMNATRRKPQSLSFVGSFLNFYMHTRCLYDAGDYWRPELVGRAVFAQ